MDAPYNERVVEALMKNNQISRKTAIATAQWLQAYYELHQKLALAAEITKWVTQ